MKLFFIGLAIIACLVLAWLMIFPIMVALHVIGQILAIAGLVAFVMFLFWLKIRGK